MVGIAPCKWVGWGYNVRTRMPSVLHSPCFALLAGLCIPLAAQDGQTVAPEPAEDMVEDVVDASAVMQGQASDAEEAQPGVPELSPASQEEMVQVGREFLQASTDMWYLLANVRSRKDADAAADPMTRLVARIYELDEKMSTSAVVVPDAACAGMMDTMQLRILDSLENVNEEFLSLRRIHCYGSERLIRAFRLAGKAGLFAEDDVDSLTNLPAPYTEEQAAAELARLQKLLVPDQEVHLLLVTVVDAGSANNALPRLRELDQSLRGLAPAAPRGVFADEQAPEVRRVVEPLVQTLWNIRNEIVRLAALPGYGEAAFDDFSEQLDRVFDALEVSHSVWFEDVFDASFRSDLDDAFHDNIKTANH